MSNEGIFDKVKDFLKGNPDKVDQGLDKAGELINERTGGKYPDQIDKGDDMVRQQLGVPDDQAATGTVPTPESDPDVAPAPTPEVPTPPSTPDTVPDSVPDSVPDPAPDTTNETYRG